MRESLIHGDFIALGVHDLYGVVWNIKIKKAAQSYWSKYENANRSFVTEIHDIAFYCLLKQVICFFYQNQNAILSNMYTQKVKHAFDTRPEQMIIYVHSSCLYEKIDTKNRKKVNHIFTTTYNVTKRMSCVCTLVVPSQTECEKA